MGSLLIDASAIAVTGYCTSPVRSWGIQNDFERADVSVDFTFTFAHVYVRSISQIDGRILMREYSRGRK